MINPYAESAPSSMLESTAILGQLLRPQGYSRSTITDIAVTDFLEHERQNIHAPASMHLLALKKSLLYAIPVIAPLGSTTGIQITTQVATPAIQYNSKQNKATKAALAIGDKFRLIGLSFPSHLVNHLSYDIFPWKFFNTLPIGFTPTAADLSKVKGIETKDSPAGTLFIIDSKYYEDELLFNSINKIIAFNLQLDFTTILSLTSPNVKHEDLMILQRLAPYNSLAFIDKLNEVLPRQIDRTYMLSFYEALQMTANWLLYDQIELLGFDSSEVNQYLSHLAYVKAQNKIVQRNLRDVRQQLLLNTRAEKITRDKFPHFFDFTDRRSIFVRFNRFSIDKLPKKEKNEVKILLEKSIAEQKAILTNKCEHLIHLKKLSDSQTFKEIESFIDYDSIDESKMAACKLCKYPLICSHEIDFYEALASIDLTVDGSDQIYWVRQKIINKYKVIDQKRIGDEETEASFTFYCKYCGGELGKSEDIIQSSLKAQTELSGVYESDPVETSIYTYISGTVGSSMNQSIVPMNKKSITKLIFEESKDEIKRYLVKANKSENENIELFIRYLCTIYSLASLISINTNKLKSSESILILPKLERVREAEPVGGVQLKDELITALKIMQSTTTFKRIGITDDKIKSMLIEAFKFMNRIFASEAIQLKSTTPRDRLTFDIKTSPIANYAKFVHNQDTKTNANILDILGVNMDLLFPKSKKVTKPSSHALYANIYRQKKKNYTDAEKYASESYQAIVDLVSQEPVNGKYISVVTPRVSDFVKTYEKNQNKRIKLKQTTPIRFLPDENGREYDFELKIFQIAYCLNEDGSVRPHRWNMSKSGSQLVYTCRYCDLDISKASKTLNDKIEEGLDKPLESFFGLYTITCPVKDAHIFESNTCIQCQVTKDQLNQMDPKYYRQYASVYAKRLEAITKELVKNANEISSYAKPLDKTKLTQLNATSAQIKPDLVKLESLASSLSKLYNHSQLKSIGIDSAGNRSLDIIESYVRLFYSYYTFASNISISTRSHPDIKFFSFLKERFFNGVKPKQLSLTKLPSYLSSTNADQLLIELFQMIYNLASNGDIDTNDLVKFILAKIVGQDSFHKEFNFAKLKSVASTIETDEMVAVVEDPEEDEEELDMFNGYDIDEDDAEDNMDGDYNE